MINIENISFSYGEKKVFTDFSLKIEKNDRICLFGESGCGKSTLIRLILGLEKPDKGSIDILPPLKPSVVFQDDRLLPFKTVLDNILFVGANKDTALSNLTALGIADCADKFPSELSGGMRRRVALARALSSEYDYLILDEPFAGLDENNTEIAAKHIDISVGSRPIILVSHSKREADLLFAETVDLQS